jgi:hypothetical protein
LPDRSDEAECITASAMSSGLAIALLELDRLGAEDHRPSPAMLAAPRTRTISGEVP